VNRIRVAWVLLAALWLGGASCLPLHAENLGPGGGTRILAGDQIIGPYRIYATVSPEPAYTGTLTFVVRVRDHQTNRIVPDAEITVTLTDPSDPTNVLSSAASHTDAGNPVDYAAHILVDRPASYAGRILVRGSAGEAELTFIEPVSPPRRLGGALLAGVPFLVVLVVLGGIWYARSGKRT
jgi:hypothetical protein